MAINNLTALKIKKAKPGRLSDGGGLIAIKRETTGFWAYRFTLDGRRREIGLGSFDHMTLAEARKARDEAAAKVRKGRHPKAADRVARTRADATFEDMALEVFESLKGGLRGDGTRGQWFSPLAVHVIPKIGHRKIAELDQHDIKAALDHVWKTSPSSAIKAIQRTRIVFEQSRLRGLDCDPFQVDAARLMLGTVITTETPIPATPWQEIPALFARLAAPGASNAALRWMILTCARSESARGARFCEIEGDIWTIPADRMKGRRGKARDFRVPLSTQALELVEGCRRLAMTDYLFDNMRGTYITSTATQKALNVRGEAGRPHGFRTSFRTWVQDTQIASYDVAETALAHAIGNKVERAYARSDLLEPRRALMQAWADYVTGVQNAPE